MFLYVKSGGTADAVSGRFATPKTGTWATAFADPSEYFDDIDTAAAAHQEGDVTLLSDAHISTGASSSLYEDFTPGALYTVSDVAVDQVVPAVTPQFQSGVFGASVTPAAANLKGLIVEGLFFNSTGTVTLGNAQGFSRYHDVQAESRDANSARRVYFTKAASGARGIIQNADINFPAFLQGLTCTGSETQVLFLGGRVVSGTTRCVTHDIGEQNFSFIGTDFSPNQSGMQLMEASSTGLGRTTFFYHWEGCPLPAGYTIDDMNSMSCAALIENCDRDNQWDYYSRVGFIRLNTSVFYTTDELLEDGVSRASLRYLSEAGAGPVRAERYNPLMPMMPYGPKFISRRNTTYATTPKARFKLLSADALTEASIDVYLLYPKDTTPYHYRSVRHHVPLIKTPAPLATETGKWTGGAGVQYIFDIDMPNGADGLVKAMVGLNNDGADMDIYLSPQIDFVA